MGDTETRRKQTKTNRRGRKERKGNLITIKRPSREFLCDLYT